jgi:hypothetical protein
MGFSGDGAGDVQIEAAIGSSAHTNLAHVGQGPPVQHVQVLCVLHCPLLPLSILPVPSLSALHAQTGMRHSKR